MPGEPKFNAWDEVDSMIISWLWQSMALKVSHTCLFLSLAKEIWDTVYRIYSKVKDATQIYEIQIKIFNTKQGSKFVTKYYILMKSLWQELDHYQCITLKDHDAATFKRFIEKQRIFEHVIGLNSEFVPVRVQILGREDVLSLNETIAIVLAEEGH